MNNNIEKWQDYIVTVGGIDFRPVSMGTLTLLYHIQSPLVVGGDVEPLDFCVFAWIHAAPIMEVYAAVKSGTYIKKAVMWGAEVPPVIFSSYIPDTIAQLADDLNKVFIEEKSGYIPFPVPSQCKPSCLMRVWNFITRPFQRG